MIDEFFERLVDRACIAVPRYLKPRTIAFTDTGFGWRVCLYIVTACRRIKSIFHNLKDEDNAEVFFKETLAKGGDQIDEVKLALLRVLSLLAPLDAVSRQAGFCGMLFLMLLAALGAAAAGGAAIAGCAAAFACFWLAEGMELDYRPVCGGLRQRYLAGMLLRGGGYCALILWMFRRYAAGGLPTNIVLQGAMIITMTMHAVLFLAVAAFERRQMLILRLLTGVLGLLPALSCAAALALAASMLGAGGAAAVSGCLAAAGASLLFVSELARMILEIGLFQAPFSNLIRCILKLSGAVLLLCGAWIMI